MNIQLLDTTLRDGGLGLEDAFLNGISQKCFRKKEIDEIILNLKDSNVDIIELGSIEISEDNKNRFGIYQDIQSISKKMPKKHGKNQLFAALYRGPDTPLSDIPNWNKNLCECVRVILRYSELTKSLDFCEALSKKGYKVFVQPMLTMRYSDEQIDMLIKRSNEMNAYALYFVDSYGYMTSDDVLRLFRKYNSGLNKNIRIGFHAHNNMNLAFSNVLSLLKEETDRDIVIDSCVTGMGQGAGNLQTELIVPHLNEHFNKNYNYDCILNIAEILERLLSPQLWGYSVVRLLPALHKCAYKYAISFRYKYKLSYIQINKILSLMDNDLKQRYTADNAKTAIDKYL